MSYQNGLLDAVMDDHLDVANKNLACQSDKDPATISRYRSGEIQEIPLAVWRALWKLTHDHRIISLITQDEEVVVTPVPKPVGGIEALKGLLDAKTIRLKAEESVLKILADGKINQHDKPEVEKLIKTHKESLAAEVLLVTSIQAECERSAGDKFVF